jgi:hypothetical protein
MSGSDYCEFSHERGRRRPTGKKGRAAREGEREREEGLRGVEGHLQEVALVAWAQAGGGIGGLQGQPRSCSLSSTRKTTETLQKAP